jgi:hypothetical protein
LAASDLSDGFEQLVEDVMLSGSLRFDVIVPLQRFLGGFLGVFAGEDAGFGGQAVGQAGLVGILTAAWGRGAVTLAAISPTTSIL